MRVTCERFPDTVVYLVDSAFEGGCRVKMRTCGTSVLVTRVWLSLKYCRCHAVVGLVVLAVR